MYILVIMFLIMSALVVPLVAKRSGGAYQQLAQPKTGQQPIQQLSVVKNNIVSRLNSLLEQKNIDEVWYKVANDFVLDLVPIDKALALEYLNKIQNKTAQVAAEKAILSAPASAPVQLPTSAPETTAVPVPVEKKQATAALVPTGVEKSGPVPPKSIIAPAPFASEIIPQPQLTVAKNDIVAQLDEKLLSTTIGDEWYAQVNDLIFDLAALDRNLSQEYLKKIRIKTAPVIVPQPVTPAVDTETAEKEEIKPVEGKKPTVPSAAEPMKRGIPPAAPPAGGMKQGTPPPPPVPGGMKKPGNAGGPPPPPGPMKKGEKKAPAQKGQAAPAVPKGPEPLTIKESYGARQLEKRSTEEITELFNKLLEALGIPDFWDAVKKEPKLDWNNKISTVKKTLADPKRNVTFNAEQMIKDRIQQVKAEKAQQGLQKQQQEAEQGQKKEEGYSEEDLISEIEQLMKAPKAEDQLWLLKFMANVKNLNKINPEKAVEYEAAFLKKFPGKKAFLPKKKP